MQTVLWRNHNSILHFRQQRTLLLVNKAHKHRAVSTVFFKSHTHAAMCGGQRTTFWCRFSLSSMSVLRTDSDGWASLPTPPNHLPSSTPNSFSSKRTRTDALVCMVSRKPHKEKIPVNIYKLWNCNAGYVNLKKQSTQALPGRLFRSWNLSFLILG